MYRDMTRGSITRGLLLFVQTFAKKLAKSALFAYH